MGFWSWEQNCTVSWENNLAYEITITAVICVVLGFCSILRYS